MKRIQMPSSYAVVPDGEKPFLAAAAHFVTHGPHLRTISVSLISSL